MRSGRVVHTTIKVVLLATAAIATLLLLPPLLFFLYFLLFVRPLSRAEKHEPSEPRSGGIVKVCPDSVEACGAPTPVTVTYAVGPGGISKGGAVRLCPGKILEFSPSRRLLRLQWGSGWGALQAGKPEKLNYLDVSTGRGDALLEVSMMERALKRTQLAWLKRKFLQRIGRELEPIDPRDAYVGNQKVTARVSGGRLEEGDTVVFTLGDGSGLEVPRHSMETDFAIEVDPDGSGHFTQEAAVPTLKATGGRPDALEVVAPSRAAPGETIDVLVRCLDSHGELSPGFRGRLSISSTDEIDTPDGVLVVEGGQGTAWFRAAVRDVGVGRIRVRGRSGDLEGESNPIVCAAGPWRLLWGDIHTHSLISDGNREPSYCYRRARELLGWDFTAVTDHDIWTLAEEHPRTAEEFDLSVRMAEEHYRPGGFVTFPAYEWTDHRLGHRNVVFGPGEAPVFYPSTDGRFSTPAALTEALSGRNVIVIPHHPAWKTHFGDMHFDYGPASSPLSRLVEVFSKHGNSEYYGCPKPMTHTGMIEGKKGWLARAFPRKEFASINSGSYVRDALAAGHRLGFIAGSDEHLVGLDPRRGIAPNYEGGITGVFASSCTRESVWDGLYNRRVCATTGPRIYMELRADGHLQGSELTTNSPPHFTGFVVGTSPIELAEIVKFDGGDYSTPWRAGGSDELVIDFRDSVLRGGSFYYLRVVQQEGHLGWAGPIWVDRAT